MSKIYWSWSNISGSLKRVWQNITRGWNDSDCWYLDITIAKFALPRLKKYRETVHGHPTMHDYKGKDYEIGMKLWKEKLDKMIYSFESIIIDSYYSTDEIDKEIQEGLNLFAKYYRNLWD